MRRQILAIVFVSSLLMALTGAGPVLGQALSLQGMADCEGWGCMATLNYPAGVYSADLDYSVVLTEQSGAEVVRFDWAGVVNRFEDATMVKMFDDVWGQSLDTVYLATFTFHFLGEEAVMTFDVVCGDPVDPGEGDDPVVEPCHRTYFAWRADPDSWPLTELLIGQQMFQQDELLKLRLDRRARFVSGLVRQVVAAKLNVAAGCADDIVGTLERADQLLASAFAGERARGRRWNMDLRKVQRQLQVYNNQPCDGAVMRGLDHTLIFGDTQLDDDADKTGQMEDSVTFSGLKAMYR